MAGTVVIGCADQAVAYELRSQIAEAADVEVVGVAETTTELAELVVARTPNVVLVHDRLGPEPVHQVIRDLGLRRPTSVSIVVSSDHDQNAMVAAMDAGARGVLVYPLAFAEVQQRVANALDWSRHMSSLMSVAGEGGSGSRGRATVIALTGTKGGVGVTTIATHLCWDIRREVPSCKVLIVDLDLEKGDVTSLIQARYRTSIADLAKVAQDLSARTVADAVFEHESGLHLLLPPEDVREVESVTPAAIRQIVALLRQQYDLIVIDAGSRVSPLQVAVVEISDEVVSVVTPDLISLRALRRNLGWWEALSVRKPDEVRVLLNRQSRVDEVQPETARRLSPAPLLDTVLPSMGRKLETSANSRSPELVEDAAWWKALRAFGREIGAVRRQADVESVARGSSTARATDRGSASIELLGVLPWIALVCALLWQLGIAGVTYVWTGHAASVAARSVALGRTELDVREAAEESFPVGWRDGLTVTLDPLDPTTVTVLAQVPLLVPGVLHTPWDVEVQRAVVSEP